MSIERRSSSLGALQSTMPSGLKIAWLSTLQEEPSTKLHVFDSPISVCMDIQSVRVVVHSCHAVGSYDTVVLRKISAGKILARQSISVPRLRRTQARLGLEQRLTISSWLSPIFLPASLLSQSSFEPEAELELPVIPGTTRGIVNWRI